MGEASALEWLMSIGAHPYVPFGRSPNCDLMADLDGRPLRIQVKTSRRRTRTGWEVSLATRGGNQSWSGVAKLFDSSRSDYVFIVVADGRRWLIPSPEISAKHSMVVGPRKWARFEIERGRPLAENAEPTVALDSRLARWGTEAVKRDAL